MLFNYHFDMHYAKHSDQVFDVLIVGSGPAGLSIATELAQRNWKVMVVDKKTLGEKAHIPKSWFVPWDCFYEKQNSGKTPYPHRDPDVEKCRLPAGVMRFLAKTCTSPNASDPTKADGQWESLLFGPHDDKTTTQVALEDRYPFVDEHAIMEHWHQKLLEAGGHFGSRLIYRDHLVDKKNKRVKVRFFRNLSEKTDYADQAIAVDIEARLLLDASGSDSDILKHCNVEMPNLYWWSVFGAIGKHKPGQILSKPDPNNEMKLAIGDYMLWQTFADTNLNPNAKLSEGRPVFEYEVLDKDTSFSLILYLRKYKIGVDRMRTEFMDIIRHEDATKPFHSDTMDIKEYKYGWYPSGGLSRSYAEDHIDFVGDAGCWTTPCGWGMGFVLKNYSHYANGVDKLLRKNKLGKRHLRRLVNWKKAKRGEFLLNTFATHFLSNGTAKQLDTFIDMFNSRSDKPHLDPLICERLFTLRAEFKDLLSAAHVALRRFGVLEIISIIPKGERFTSALQILGVLLQYIREFFQSLVGIKPTRGFRIFG